MIAFTVNAVPVAQPRGRASFSKSGKPFVRSANESHKGPPLAEPLRMRIVFVMPRPEGKFWKSKPMPRYPYAVKGRHDWDNLGKGVCDALNKKLFADDGLIAYVIVEKWVAAGDEQAHVEIELAPLAEGPASPTLFQ